MGGPARVQPPRKVGLASLIFLGYMCVCAGPYGIETAVQAGGAFMTLLFIGILVFAWAIPQSLLTAEMSTMEGMEDNGGYVLWVDRGLGPLAAVLSSYNSTFSNICDLPLYCILFSSYLEPWLVSHALDPSLGHVASYITRVAVLVAATILNVVGLQAISLVSAVVLMLILVPFVAEIPLAWNDLSPSVWGKSTDSIDFALFLSTMLWNFQGWDALGCVAGEVENGARNYPLGVILTVFIIAITYAIPVMIGVSVDPNFADWDDGHLSTVATTIAPWVGSWVVFGAALSNTANLNVMMSTSSRALWAMAHRRFVPHGLGRSWHRFKTPTAAIAFMSVTTFLLLALPFNVLIVVDTTFNNVSLILESVSFLRLRYTEPDTKRGYTLPGGFVMAWVVVILKQAVITFALATAGWLSLSIVAFANVAVVVLYFAFLRGKAELYLHTDLPMQSNLLQGDEVGSSDDEERHPDDHSSTSSGSGPTPPIPESGSSGAPSLTSESPLASPAEGTTGSEAAVVELTSSLPPAGPGAVMPAMLSPPITATEAVVAVV